jgi:hypothetical protein
MGVALAAIADDGDLLALDQVQVGVAIVVNTHEIYPLIEALGLPWALWSELAIGRTQPADAARNAEIV